MRGFLYNKIFATALCVLLLTTVGCGKSDEKRSDQTDAYEQTTPITQSVQEPVSLGSADIVHVFPDRIDFFSTTDQTTPLHIAADQPRDVVWNEQTRTLFWIQHAPFNAETESEKPAGYVIRRFQPDTGITESVHWSRKPMEHLAISFDATLLSFAQENVVYVLHTQRDEMERIAGWAERVVWAPRTNALIVSAPKLTEYVAFDDEGKTASRIQIAKKFRFAGAAFIDEKTIIGLQWNQKKVLLQSIDLRDGSVTVLDTWSDDPADAANQYFSLFPDATAQNILIHQVLPDEKQGTVWHWSAAEGKKKERRTVVSAHTVLRWISDTAFLYTTSDVQQQGQHIVDLYAYDITNDRSDLRAAQIDSPVIIQYSL